MSNRIPAVLPILLLGLALTLGPFDTLAIHTDQGTVTTAGTTSSATMAWSVDSADGSGYTALFDTDDSVSVSLTIEVDSASVGAERNLYLAALLEDVWFMRDTQGNWRAWSGLIEDLVPFRRNTLAATEILDVHDGAPLPPGEYAVFAGYDAGNGAIVYNRQPLTFIVFNTANPSLHRFRNQATLENYLVEAMIEAYASDGDNPIPNSGVGVSAGLPAPVSQTNLQEQGVDEADLIKTDGQYLYSLGSCSSSVLNSCLSIHSIMESPPANQLLNEIDIPGEASATGIYLLKERGEGLSDLIVTAGGLADNDYMNFGVIGVMPIWEGPRFWSNSKTEINLFRLDSADAPTHDRTIVFDGAMISSRVIDDTLYLVTRYTPTAEDLDQYASTTAALNANRTLLESTSLSQLLPSATTNETSRPLIDAGRCYLAPSATAVNPDPTIINVIAIALTDPDNFRTTCFLGESEVLYASQDAIYLAAVAADRFLLTGGGSAQQTEIHKLALTTDSGSVQAAEYRGSAQIVGHLGFNADYKPFRMGEHQGVLRIATSIGSLGSDGSSTSVTLLREAANGGRLEEAGRLDNLGRPGELLYASRFLGDRGYLVTFKKIDPLYVLDLSDPENPVSLGELEVSGYSEYLHPVGENFLLGIGKEAIDDEASTDRDGLGFAWYQGLKVSLFDVTDPTTPTEVNSIVLGGRRTSSNILTEHHAFASLPQTDLLPMRFSIPLDLYNEPPQVADPQPYHSYGWTHTGLYTFDVHVGAAPGVELVDQFVVRDNSTASASSGVWNDRSVILGDSVHYLHGGSLYSSSLPARQ
ncbi:MAG: beta-propeller domain-containing protein [Candidatus Thiodiazotropha sp.]